MSTSIVAELDRIVSTIEADESQAEKVPLNEVAEKIAAELRVKADEVAILAVSTRWRHLFFLVPQALKNVGYIPLTSNSALAARTARESRPDIDNNFPAARHATVFEGVKAATISGEAIQKIVSAPILNEGRVVGVIQISRKGGNAKSAGPDFTVDDLGKVLAICQPLGKLLKVLAGE